MRNLWTLMKTFNVLPTNEDFRKLSHVQIDLMIYSMEEDYRQAELARKGLQVDSEHYDNSFEEEVWSKEVGEWDVLKEGHDAEKIAKQVEALTRAEDLKNLGTKFEGLDEYNAHLEAGGKTARETAVEQTINKNLADAYEKAQRIAKAGKNTLVDDAYIAGESEENTDLDKEAMDKAIRMFNQQDDDDEYTEL
ncbi:hypothetical protein BCP01_060 [Bacillus phage BCP01]|nr:hypothetical protein BCP01_060 [Bacillus phage BCP01]